MKEQELERMNNKSVKIKMEKEKIGLVLEGGGMRGVFTAGVLDCFIDHAITFPYAIGVSAGASNGMSYISQQRGRSRFSNIDLLKKYDYIGFNHLLQGKGYIDMDYLFDVYPEKYFPFDFKTYFESPCRFVMVASNCETGQAEYLEERHDPERLAAICRASCSLPILCPITYVDNKPMVDGGVCDAVPIHRAIQDGYTKNVIILTRNKGYRKANREIWLPEFLYHQYPELRKQFAHRYIRYNEVMDFIEDLEAKGEAWVIRPEKELTVGRTTHNPKKLAELYEEGYQIGERFLQQVNNFNE